MLKLDKPKDKNNLIFSYPESSKNFPKGLKNRDKKGKKTRQISQQIKVTTADCGTPVSCHFITDKTE